LGGNNERLLCKQDVKQFGFLWSWAAIANRESVRFLGCDNGAFRILPY
jgi:hypothetical protein